MATRSRTALAVVAAAAALPGTALGSTISSDGTLITFRSGARPADMAMTGSTGFGTYAFADAAGPLVAGAGCTAGPPVTCSGLSFDVRLGGGADRAKVLAFADVREAGGSGADELFAYGNGVATTAGPGDDLAVVSGNGPATATGDGGDDTLYSGGFGGTLSGGDGRDLVVGDGASANWLSGGGSADALVAHSASDGGALDGGAGRDVLVVRDDGTGAGAAWTLDGGPGDDVVAGGPGADAVTAGSGRDIVDVSADGQPDRVTCGDGTDTVWADPADAVARDCEVVHRAAAPALPDVVAARAAAARLAADVAAIDPSAPGPMLGAG